MSGIAGIYNRNDQPVDQEQLVLMGKALAHRGPDGIDYYRSNTIGLVHCMLYDTPESLCETLPHRSAEQGIVITWHGRIDNRQELKDQTGWSHPLARTLDSDLILAAYDKWGKNCVNYLLGDFAFVLWDERENILFCARDHMGVKPFYYTLTDSFFAFASEIKGLLVLPQYTQVINEERIADYLTCVVTETTSTFYKNILRLPPGHSLTIAVKRDCLHRYWEPHPATNLMCRNSGEYKEQFYAIFANTVRCRLRSGFPVGSLLSGGIDSSSIVCMAAGPQEMFLPSPLHTFSGIFAELKICDERDFFQSVLDRYPVVPHFVYADRINPGSAFDHVSRTEDEPFWAPHFFMLWELMILAERTGIRILLDGHDGDSAVSHGYGQLTELLLRGRWVRLSRECHAAGNSSSLKKTMRILFGVCKDRILLQLAPVFPVAWQKNYFGEMICNLNTSLIPLTGIRDRLAWAEERRPKPGQCEFERHRRTISNPLHSMAIEFLERQGMQRAIVSRYPFFDKRLIEFCLALPPEEKFSNGYTRSIVRRSLNDILPEIIKKRKNKTDFMPSLRHAFSSKGKEWRSFYIDRENNPVYTYLNRNKITELCSSFILKPSTLTLMDFGLLLRGISLAKWLRNK